ncbi:hypothetical protein Cpin_2055 [Chitinophaga pinensis DSM 2588]|uniref:DUF4421 domain-containing protein n=1 Tax=Chitinophaga pinensis (strain ATCC 43595 / DSM 2588 / LMG 13176 / NBRC 15968 / NCIMB 11800 / UQM 2034) TaxID=485918 RepID=A0A979G2G6_CHIPD|nr:hypothetical protein Cpin_2055 [Chitinophaga pinensis DSM 2588]
MSFKIVPVHGQQADTRRVNDSLWIQRFDDQIITKLAIINTAEILAVEGDNFKNVLKPNPSEIFRAYFNYRFLSFYVSHTPHFLPGNNDDDIKGRTSGIGLGTSFNFRNWFTDIFYSHTNGYYLSNIKDYRPDWQPGDPYFLLPDLTVNSLSGSIGYNTNPHLSLQSTVSQTERQIRSAGAFLPKISYRYYTINSPGITFSQKSRNIQALIGAGYQYTFVLRKAFYVTGSFTPSFGYIFYRLQTQNGADYGVSHARGPIYQWDALLGTGYSGNRFFAGAYLTATSSTYAQGLTTAVNQDGQIYFQLFAGIRLKAPKILEKNYDKIFH